MSPTLSKQDKIKTLNQLINKISFGMLTTTDKEGHLHSRPMTSCEDVDVSKALWFFTGIRSHKVDEIKRNHEVNISYASPEDHSYVSLRGNAEIVLDRPQMEALWRSDFATWFPKGLDDPDLVLLKVAVEDAEYWDSRTSAVAEAVDLIKSFATGTSSLPKDTEHRQIKI